MAATSHPTARLPEVDAVSEAGRLEQALGHRLAPARWMGWRLRLLLVAALAGGFGLFLFAQSLTVAPHLDAVWRTEADGGVLLLHADDEPLRSLQGRRLAAITAQDQALVPLDALLLQRSPRWVVDDRLRAEQVRQHLALARLLALPQASLVFDDERRVPIAAQGRGWGGLGTLFWLVCALAFGVYLVGMVVVLARPAPCNLLYAVIAWAQSATLLVIAVESLPGLGLPSWFPAADPPLRMALDLVSAAALVHSGALHPRRLPAHALIAALAWAGALTTVTLVLAVGSVPAWWTVQAVVLAYSIAFLALLTWSHRIERHPAAVVLRRIGAAGLGTLVLLTVAVAWADHRSSLGFNIPAVGSAIWHVFLASLLLLVPFLSRSRQMLREFSLLAGVSTIATSLDLLFVAAFSWGQFASLTLALFLSLGAYACARQWILNHLLGSRTLTTERMFERLYRIAREVQARPKTAEQSLTRLLRELFDPLEVRHLQAAPLQSRVLSDGSTLLVPVPNLVEPPTGPAAALVLRFAQRGRRIFTSDDAALADGIVEQLQRAVAYDQAVERGRSEERLRIAQDLHDDIGARLLTLMYQAPTPEVEAYVRHTLQDLKTLTRGLAASNHTLAHAAAEWKADITQRLASARCELHWSFEADDEVQLNVVQWSGLTRILRELISNTIAHAHASTVSVDLRYRRGRLQMTVCDNGLGKDPAAWSHGLGLGGIRKRAKQLGAHVAWRPNQPQGICCEVDVPDLRSSA